MASLDAFKNGDVDLIVCSDVAARGLDIPDVSHVFNFDVPTHAEDYVHRIGRTGRAGKSGTALSIVTRADLKYVEEIEKLIARKIDWIGPNVSEIEPDDGEDSGRSRFRERREREPSRGRRHDRGTAHRPASHREPRGVENGQAGRLSPHAGHERGQPTRFHHEPQHERRPGRFDEDQAVVGLGDHVPLFLLRPVKLKPAKVAAEEE